MATATHIPTKWMKAQAAGVAAQIINLADTTAGNFVCGIVVAGAGIPSTSSSGIQYIADITGTNTEMSYAGYARQSLTGITWAFDATLGQVDWSFSNIVFPQEAADPGTGRYAFIAYKGVGSGDATYPVVGVLDLGATVSTVNGSLTLTCPAGGLIQFQGGG